MSDNNQNENEENELKIILLGECGVGKTNIILRYIKNKFDDNADSTTGSIYTMKEINKDNINYKLNIWDTAGQEKYHSVTKMSLQEANIIILVYSIIDEHSFAGLNFWYKTAIDICGKNTTIAVVGNKIDLFLEAAVDEEKAKNYAQSIKAIFKLVSAKEDKNGIDELFDQVLDEYIKRKSNKYEDGDEKKSENVKSQNIKIEDTENKHVENNKKKKCC